MNVDDLAQEIRRVDGSHSLGAGALAEALMPFIEAHLAAREADAVPVAWVSPQSLRNLSGGQSTREWMWAENEEGDIPLYAAPRLLGMRAALEAALASLGDVVAVPREVYDFLMGVGELRGLYFGDRGTHRGAYWWREDLSATLNRGGK